MSELAFWLSDQETSPVPGVRLGQRWRRREPLGNAYDEIKVVGFESREPVVTSATSFAGSFPVDVDALFEVYEEVR